MMSRIPQILSVRLQTSVSLRKRKCSDSQIGRPWKIAALCPVGTNLHHQSVKYRINIWVVLGAATLNTSLPHHKKKKKCSWLSHRTTNKGHRTGWQTHCDGYEAAQPSLNHLGSMDSIKSHRIRASVGGGKQGARATARCWKWVFSFSTLVLNAVAVATGWWFKSGAGVWGVWARSSRMLLTGLYFFHIFDCICAGSAYICRYVIHIK